MKFLLKGEEKYVSRFTGSVSGVQCDEIVLNLRDFRILADMTEKMLADYMKTALMCRFVPEIREHKTRVPRS